jgi:hypothetical protein
MSLVKDMESGASVNIEEAREEGYGFYHPSEPSPTAIYRQSIRDLRMHTTSLHEL